MIWTFLTLLAFQNDSVTASWSKNTEPDVLYYTIYRGTRSGEYLFPKINVQHPDTSIVIGGLSSNVEYFFAVTATDSSGNESGYSDEVRYIDIDTTGFKPEILDGFSTFNPLVWKIGTNAANATTVENGVLALRSTDREAGWIHSLNKLPLVNRIVEIWFAKTGGSSNIGFSPALNSSSIDGIISEPNMIRIYIAHVSATERGIYLQEKKNGVATINQLLASGAQFMTSPVALKLDFSDTTMDVSYRFAGPYNNLYRLPIDNIYRQGSFIELSSYYTISWGEAHVDSIAIYDKAAGTNIFDLNSDNIVDVLDWILLLRHVGINQDSPLFRANMDFNTDGWIDGLDKAFFARESKFA
jgi:hypothetical protein